MSYEVLKTLHILSSILLFGTGLGSAFYSLFVSRTGNVAAIAVTDRLVVLADWLFTTPTIIVQPVTGFMLIHTIGYDWSEPWILISLVLYAIAGACWLPVVWLQIRMRDISADAVITDKNLPDIYHRYRRIWFWLGVPAFNCMVAIVTLMIFKPDF